MSAHMGAGGLTLVTSSEIVGFVAELDAIIGRPALNCRIANEDIMVAFATPPHASCFPKPDVATLAWQV